jgi:hypothetical protein
VGSLVVLGALLFTESEAGLMRFLAFFAPHPWLRNGLVLIAVAAMLWGGARLWTSGPDAVHITITHVDGDGLPRIIKTVTYDRTIPNSAVAQRLQRDLAAMPLITDPFATFACPLGNFTPSGTSRYDSGFTYDAYTLTWYRAGLPVEQASADRTGCAFWRDDGVLSHRPYGAEVLYADINAAVHAGG